MADICCVNEARVNEAKAALPTGERLYGLAELFKMFGDQTRMNILCVLLERELCVGDIAAALDMGQSAISHQLRLLRASKLVRSRRQGKTVFYSLDDSHVHDMISLGLDHINEKSGEDDD